jgi:proteasome lid subunit RPN8/RPN11
MIPGVQLQISSSVLKWIKGRARAAGREECMGLLTIKRGNRSRIICGACQLPAEASGSRAEAAPLEIARAAARLQLRSRDVIGIWHSHGSHAVFHSDTDDDTVLRLLPAMAERNFEWPTPPVTAPVVTGPDSAAIPFPDGRVARFSLEGETIPGLEARELATWTRITTTFEHTHLSSPARLQAGSTGQGEPRAVLNPDQLRLQAAGVILVLGIPTGASIRSQIDDPTGLARAHLFSLVVNNRGDAYAEAMVIDDRDGESVIDKGPCGIEILPDRDTQTPLAGRGLYRENGAPR